MHMSFHLEYCQAERVARTLMSAASRLASMPVHKPGSVGMLATLLLALAGANAQTPPRVKGPVLGYVWDQGSSGLRPILGIPGSSTLGPLLDLGVSIRLAEISPAQDYALA